MIKVRIRGIASTALSKIFLDAGYKIVQASETIRERFNLENDTSPADVTIKDSDESDSILVVGFYEKAKEVYEYISSKLEYVFNWRSPIGLYSIVKGVVVERSGNDCVIDLGGLRGVLRGCRDGVGDRVLVSVIKTAIKPGETILLSYDLKLVGELVTVTYGSRRLTVSEHIRDLSKRGELASIGLAKGFATGMGIHFRSSSQYASREAIEREIDELTLKLKEIVQASKECREDYKIIYEGEFIGLIGLTSIAKERLDHYRGLVTPTIKGHHSFKFSSRTLSEFVDKSEAMVKSGELDVREAEEKILAYIVEETRSRGVINLIHVKPSGELSRLTPGELVDFKHVDGGFELVIKRVMRSDGVYDGLGVEKRAGDIDYVYIRSNEWFLSHNYYRDGSWIGSYININTPVELSIGMVKYHDLLLDVVVRNDGDVIVGDVDEFEKHCGEGLIGRRLCEEAYVSAMSIKKDVSKYVYRPSS